MREVLERYPGAQRALFRHYHIGGCSSCGFQPNETLEHLCARNNHLEVAEVLGCIQASHEQDQKLLMTPAELAKRLEHETLLPLVDIRTREEWDTGRIEGAVLLTQDSLHKIFAEWPRNKLVVIYDHQGRQSLDAAAYFIGHGFEQVRCLEGGIDAWALQIDTRLRRYRLEV
jgi:rhodanese-related sulfurtransferase